MASILDTFIIRFVADSIGAKKGTDEVKQSTEELDKSLQKVNQTSKITSDTVAGLSGAFKGALVRYLGFAAVAAGVKSAVAYTEALDKTAKSLNANVEDLDAWSKAVEESGGKASEFQGTLQKTQLQISQLPKLADKFQGLNDVKAGSLGKALGLDEGTVRLLQRGGKEVSMAIARQKELGVVTKRDTEITSKFNQQWTTTSNTFSSIFRIIAAEVLPIVSAFMKGLQRVYEFFNRNTTAGKVLLVVLAGIAAFLFPITALLVAIGAAFALVADDIEAFNAGGDSFIGEMIKRYPVILDIVRELGAAWDRFIEGLVITFDVIKPIFSLIGHLIGTFIESLKITANAIGVVIDAVAGLFGSKKKVEVEVSGAANSEDSIAAGKKAIASSSNNPLASQTSNSISSMSKTSTKNTTVQTGPVTIQTQATDADGIAGAFSDSLKTEMQQAMGNFSDGVAA